MQATTAEQQAKSQVRSRICYFLVHVLCVMICGSYFNFIFVIGCWLMVLFQIREHNILLTVAYAVSITLQTYQLSIDSRHVFFVSPERQNACGMSGIETIENFGLNPRMYGACNVGNFMPFQAQSKHPLTLQQDTKLMFRREEPGKVGLASDLHIATCASLGVLCYT